MFRYWLLAGFLCFCAGDLAGIYPDKAPLVAGSMLVSVVLFSCRLSPEHRNRRLLLILIFTGITLSGFWLSRQAQHPRSLWHSYIGRQITVQGEVEPGSLKIKRGGISAIVCAEKPLRGKVRVFIKTETKNREDKFPHLITERQLLSRLLQEKIQMTGRLDELVYLRNPGTYNGYLAAGIAGIYGRMSLPCSAVESTGKPLSFWRRPAALAQRLRALAAAHLRTQAGLILPGILFGGYQGVSEEDADVFRTNGMAHLLAVSGTHVTLLTAFLWVLLRPLPQKVRFYSILLLLFLYAFFCGLRPAVLRATLMAAAFLWGKERGGQISSFHLLLLTAWGMLLVKPLWLADISFQLSFITVAGLFVAVKRITAYVPEHWPDGLRSLLGISVTAQLAALPFTVFYFHRLSLIAVLSNVLLLPALETAVLIFLPGLLCLSCGWAIGQCFFSAAETLMQGVIASGKLLEQLPFAVLDVADWGILRSLCYWGFLAGFLDLGPFLYLTQRRRVCWLSVTGALFLLLWGFPLLLPRPLTVYFMDVGQGDAALIRTPAGKHILIDTGGLRGTADIGRLVLAPYLRYLGVTKLDVLCLSHGDHDHAGGAPYVAQQFSVDKVFLGNCTEASEDVQKLLNGLAKKTEKKHFLTGFFRKQAQTDVRYLQKGDEWEIGDCRIVVASASGGNNGPPAENMNEASLILQLFCDGHSLVFTGDAGMETEEMARDRLRPTEVLKVGHHGSDGSSSPFFLRHICPQIAVISCGRNNCYGHPAVGALERLRDNGSRILRTDLMGSLKAELHKDKIRWYSYRYQPGRF